MNDLPQFFINSSSIIDGKVLISGTDSEHLSRVRRVKKGTEVMLRADSGKGFIARVDEVTKEGILTTIIDELKTDNSIPDITLYMALLKGGNFEFIIQKTVELGVNRIIPVFTERTIPDPERINEKKNERWNKIAAEACKQCLRVSHAIVESPLSYKAVIDEDILGLKIICHPGAAVSIKTALESVAERRHISLLIGPEGGFSEREIAAAQNAGWIPGNLGLTHMRAETAAIVIPAIVIYEWS